MSVKKVNEMENKSKEKKNGGNINGAATEGVRELYEGSVVNRMMDRKNGLTPKGAKGIALEVMDMDQLNAKDLLKAGRKTQLTKNTRATQLDAVTVDKGKVVRRYQYKDTSKAVEKTVKQVKSGKYNQATLRGTKESSDAFNTAAEKIGLNKRMESSGISSKTTERVAGKALAVKDGVVDAATMANNVAGAAKCTAFGAVGVSTVLEVGKSIINGDSVGECANHVVSKGAESAISGAASGAAGEACALAAAMINPALAIPAAIVGGIVAAGVTGNIVNGAFDEVGDCVENIVDEVSETIDEVAFNIWNFFDTLFL